MEYGEEFGLTPAQNEAGAIFGYACAQYAAGHYVDLEQAIRCECYRLGSSHLIEQVTMLYSMVTGKPWLPNGGYGWVVVD